MGAGDADSFRSRSYRGRMRCAMTPGQLFLEAVAGSVTPLRKREPTRRPPPSDDDPPLAAADRLAKCLDLLDARIAAQESRLARHH